MHQPYLGKQISTAVIQVSFHENKYLVSVIMLAHKQGFTEGASRVVGL
jgi:hypothetical protein